MARFGEGGGMSKEQSSKLSSHPSDSASKHNLSFSQRHSSILGHVVRARQPVKVGTSPASGISLATEKLLLSFGKPFHERKDSEQAEDIQELNSSGQPLIENKPKSAFAALGDSMHQSIPNYPIKELEVRPEQEESKSEGNLKISFSMSSSSFSNSAKLIVNVASLSNRNSSSDSEKKNL
jgi:hypothetical protein